MRNLYYLVVLFIFQYSLVNGQNLNSKDLITAWKVSDKTQTIKAEVTYDDLRINFEAEKFDQVITELYNYLTKSPDPRLEIRIKIYEILGHRSPKEIEPINKEDKIKKLFEKTFSLKDRQLLSEVYSLYAEQGSGNIEDKLFYNTSATEIQEETGTKYFPKLYLRYISLSTTYYSLEDYEESIKNGYKSLNLLKNKNPDIYAFCLQYDILGASYFELNQPDSGSIYYQKIKHILAGKQSIDTYKPTTLRGNDLKQIWEGVANGGIARGLILQGKYDKAIKLLNENLASSTAHNQYGDMAKAQNLLGSAYLKKGDTQKAIAFWHQVNHTASYLHAGNRYLIYATDHLSDTYQSLGRFDSAYYYLQQKFQYENEWFSKINQSRLHNVNSRLQFEKMDSRIKNAELTIQKQHSNRNIILAGSGLLLFIIVFSYSRYRFKQTIRFKNLEIKQKISQIEKQKIEDELSTARSNIKIFIDKVNEKNELIESISQKLNELNSSEKKELNETLDELRTTKIITDEDWTSFQTGFDKVHKGFSKNLLLNFPTITPAEQRYLMLSKIGLNHKEMARVLGISSDSVRVTWNRVRNKMGGTLEDTPKSLIEKSSLKSKIM